MIFLALSSCDNTEALPQKELNCKSDSLFTICSDTFLIPIHGRMLNSIYHNESYYVFFKTTSRPYTNHLYKIPNSGETVLELNIPEKIKEWHHFDFFRREDSIYVINQSDVCYSIGDIDNDEWNKSKPVNNILFENQEFEVFGTCSGEFGGSILFLDKKNDTIYSSLSICPMVVNQIENSFYITNYMGHMGGFSGVLKIDDPRKISARHKDSTYNTPFGETFTTEGTEFLFDTIGFFIPTSFNLNGKLVHYYSTEDASFIGELENQTMKQLYQFEKPIYPFYQGTLTDGSQLLNFYSPSDSLNGFMHIKNTSIKLRYIPQE